MNETETLGSYLRGLRRALKLSIRAVAPQLGMSIVHLSRIETDRGLPRDYPSFRVKLEAIYPTIDRDRLDRLALQFHDAREQVKRQRREVGRTASVVPVVPVAPVLAPYVVLPGDSPNAPITFGAYIRRARYASSLTMGVVAEHLGVSRVHLQRIETDEARMLRREKWPTFVAICPMAKLEDLERLAMTIDPLRGDAPQEPPAVEARRVDARLMMNVERIASLVISKTREGLLDRSQIARIALIIAESDSSYGAPRR